MQKEHKTLEKEFKQVNIVEYVKEHFTKEDYQKAYKFEKVKAREGVYGEQIATITRNDIVETVNSVKMDEEGHLDWVVTNVGGEQCIIPYKTFLTRYEQTPDSHGFYKPKQGIVTVVETREDISFLAPWGSVMSIAKGGFLIINNETNIYGIQEEEFYNTYKLIDKKDELELER